MGLLDTVLSAVSSGGGQAGAQASVVKALLQQVNNYPGGVSGLIEKFQQGGLGEVISSWMGSGPNLPVSPSQLQAVLGDSMVGSLAQDSGQDQASVLGILSQVLPGLVDKATPNGEPSEGLRLDASLMGAFLGKR